MTTECITHRPADGFDMSLDAREFIAAAIAAAGVILLLPGASLLMALLTANGLA